MESIFRSMDRQYRSAWNSHIHRTLTRWQFSLEVFHRDMNANKYHFS